MAARSPAPLRLKLLFWLILAALSVLFAEVASFSSPFAFFTAWGLLVVVPLYGLHVLVLAALIFGRRRVNVCTLFLAGALLGLYEAYITKVLWDPTWGGRGLEIGGLFVLQAAILVLFWHPFMAFMIPVILGENLLTTSEETSEALPKWIRVRLRSRFGWLGAAAALGVWCGLCQMGGTPSPGTVFVADVSAVAVLFLLVAFWRRAAGDWGYSFRELLPAGREVYVLAGLLLLDYLLSAIGIRPASLPRTVVPHLSVWILYAFLGGLLWANIAASPSGDGERADSPALPAPRFGITFAVLFVFTATIFAATKGVGPYFTVFSFVLGLGLGILLLALSVISPIQRSRHG